MKWCNFKFVILFIVLVLPVTTFAQNGYEKRMEKYHSLWNKLIPTHTKLQYAGGMGFLSAGIGWDYGKKDRWETDMFLGFLPRYSTKVSKLTFTLKQNYIPWNIDLGKNFSVDPLACGLYVNTIFNGEFWVSEPDKYPSGYYSFSTKLRFHIYLGQRITYEIPWEKRIARKSVTFYYEVSSNDLYIISAAGNSWLKPSDYLRLSFGFKFQLF